MFLKCFFLNLQVNVFNIYAIDTKYLGGQWVTQPLWLYITLIIIIKTFIMRT